MFTGDVMVTSAIDSTIRFWDVSSAKCLNILRAHQSPVRALALDADLGLYSAGDDGTLYSWDTRAFLDAPPKEAVTHPGLIKDVREFLLLLCKVPSNVVLV